MHPRFYTPHHRDIDTYELYADLTNTRVPSRLQADPATRFSASGSPRAGQNPRDD